MPRHIRSARNNALVMVYAMLSIVVLMAFTSLAVDWGRVETAKTELQNATDAAARYAASGISDGTYTTKATNAAANNKVDGVALVLQAADVTVGTWDSTTRSFSAGGSSPNAVCVTGHRTAARGTGIPLLFARAIGRNTCDINSTSIATESSSGYDMVALNSITMSGSSSIRRVTTESGTVGVASNGTWSLGSSAVIGGDALYRTTPPSGGTISGSKISLGSNIAYPSATAPATAIVPYGGSFSSSYGSVTIGGGYGTDYSVYDVLLSGSFVLNLAGDAKIYCSHNCTLASGLTINTNGHTLTIYMTSNGTLALSNSQPLSLVIYGPSCAMTVNSTGTITGSFVCKTLNMSGGTIKYTATMPIPISPSSGASTSGGGVAMVK